MIRDRMYAIYNSLSKLVTSWLSRASKRISGKNFIEIIYLVILALFMAGFVNAVFFPVSNQSFIIYPQPGAQSIPETVIYLFIIFVGGAGVYLSYVSGRQTTRTRLANLYLLLSLFLLFLALMMGIYVAVSK